MRIILCYTNKALVFPYLTFTSERIGRNYTFCDVEWRVLLMCGRTVYHAIIRINGYMYMEKRFTYFVCKDTSVQNLF